MSEPETVWVLSSGEYSDYRVHCVVRGGEKDAELIAARAKATDSDGWHNYRVESLPVVNPDVDRVEVLRMTATIWDDGTTSEERTSVRVEWPFDVLYEQEAGPVHWRWVRAPIHQGKGGRLEVGGTDHERVRKVFSDRRAALMVDGALRARKEARGR